MPSIINATTTTGVAITGDNSGNLALQTAGNTAVTIDTSQNVGIGTASPDNNANYKTLTITGSTTTTGGVIGLKSSNGSAFAQIFNDSTNFALKNNSATPTIIFTSGLERMRITSGGELYVGTTTGTIDQSNFGFVVAGGELNLSRNVGGSSPTMTAYGSQGLARIMGDGDLENTNNRYTGISDIKFKQNIVDANSQWDDIKAIQVRKYELINHPDRKQIGCIAQELEQVCPGLVIERKDKDGETYKSVAYSVLYMKAVKALQEAMERIEAIEAKVDAQALEIQALKGVA
jgi:hypothetical protein